MRFLPYHAFMSLPKLCNQIYQNQSNAHSGRGAKPCPQGISAGLRIRSGDHVIGSGRVTGSRCLLQRQNSSRSRIPNAIPPQPPTTSQRLDAPQLGDCRRSNITGAPARSVPETFATPGKSEFIQEVMPFDAAAPLIRLPRAEWRNPSRRRFHRVARDASRRRVF